ncbi:MAG: carbohydrate kinase family protein [Chloroflexota bacterium]
MREKILVIGASLMDTKGQPTAGLDTGTSNPAAIRTTMGGTARNVAENLARMGAVVQLMSAVGDDFAGSEIISKTSAAGVECGHVQVVEGQNTGTYIAVIDHTGQLSVALDDTRVMASLTPDYLEAHRDLFAEAAWVVLDGGITGATLQTAVNIANEVNVPLCADPSSTRLASRLCPYIHRLSLIVPNELEAAAICDVQYGGYDPESSLSVARQLVQMGVETAVVSLSDFGLVYATGEESGYLPARFTEIIDTTGTGDAITAAILFGMINEFPTLESMRLGASAAGITLQTPDSVYSDISLDLLYEHLIV